jgi:tetratricopeptide (TPR) repeat protein
MGVPSMIASARQCRAAGDFAGSLALFRAAIELQPAHVGLRLEAAMDLLKLGRSDEAQDEYLQASLVAPAHPGPHIGLGHCARARGDRVASLAHFQAACVRDETHIWARMEAAGDLLALGRLDDSEAEFRIVLDSTPQQNVARLGLANCARKRGRFADSLQFHREILESDPSHQWARLQEAADLRELGRLEEAKAAYREALARSPGDHAAMLGLGQCERRLGDREAALAWHRKAAEAAPAVAWCRYECAVDLRDLGRLDEAVAETQAALEMQPNDAPGWMSLGTTLRQAARHDEALAAFTRSSQLQPGRAEPLVQMAIEHRTLGRQQECDRLFALAKAAEPENPALLVALGEQARIANDVPRMIDIHAQGVRLHPTHLGLNLGYADALGMQGRLNDAIAHLVLAETHCANSVMIGLRRLALLRRAGFWHAAQALARTIAAENPSNFSAWMERLACEEFVGSDADIDDCLERAPASTPRERARLARNRARIQEDRGDHTGAASSYDEAERLDPDNAETHFLRTRHYLTLLDVDRARSALGAYMRANVVTTRLRGRSGNASQTHFGQLLDDFVLDQQALQATRAACREPAPRRVDALLRVVAAYPDSTAAALSVLHALQAGGLLDRGQMRTGRSPIPRSIVQFWDSPEIPPDIAGMMASWREIHPDWAVHVFSDASARAFLEAAYGPAAAAMYARIGNPAQKADVFRLGYLARMGGVYADADDRCHARLEALLAPQCALVLYCEDFGTIGNNFIAACPRHPILRRAFSLALTCVARGDADLLWLSTGPGLMTRAFAQALAAAGANWPKVFETTMILRRRDLFSCVAIHCQTGHKSTPVYWGNAAFSRLRTSQAVSQDAAILA